MTVVVCGMVLIQYLPHHVELRRETGKPGLDRGDVILTEECLLACLGEWRRRDFTPAPSPELLSEKQTAWTHSWTFQRDNLFALITFDQADFMHWHDLTVCYQGNGWTVSNKSTCLRESEDSDLNTQPSTTSGE